ncbi:MAG: hypothetical protein GY851_31355 [bacterium]|nr:hypothetical protein [bacterium]
MSGDDTYYGEDFERCPACGKVFAAATGKRLCARCTALREADSDRIEQAVESLKKRSAEKVAQAVGVSLDRVKSLIRESSFLSSKVDTGDMCMACNRRLAQPRSNYCLRCRLELNQDLGEAIDHVATRVQEEIERGRAMAPGRPTGLRSALSDRRDQAGTDRLDPTPHNRWSG